MKFNSRGKRRKEKARILRELCPRMPLADFEQVLERAAAAGFSGLPASIAVWQALASHVRHRHSEYEVLLAAGYDRDAARYFVAEEMNSVFREWGCARRIEHDGE